MLPEKQYRKALNGAIDKLRKQPTQGLVRLKPDLRTLVIPDLHARRDYLVKVLRDRDPKTGKRYSSLLAAGKLQVVVLGDAMHSESRAAGRWRRAAKRPRGKAMRQEATESLGTMKLIMALKATYPDRFHYLKGNHDNILDERRGGNWPVSKYATESTLMRDFVEHRFGNDFLKRWHTFESMLPLVAVGNGFALAHAGPRRVIRRREIERRQHNAVENFTWTDLTRSSKHQARVAARQLAELGVPEGFFLAGHRPAERVRRQGRFFQFNNEQQMYFAVLEPGKRFNLALDVMNAQK
jgi:hypothetical protein